MVNDHLMNAAFAATTGQQDPSHVAHLLPSHYNEPPCREACDGATYLDLDHHRRAVSQDFVGFAEFVVYASPFAVSRVSTR